MGPSDLERFDHVQSRKETPCRVIGEAYGRSRTPVLSLSKWEREAGILFKCGSRGERVRKTERTSEGLMMTTNRRKHHYRRLDRENFEFDIILPEAPDSPVLTMPLEFPRGLSFYKQIASRPDRMPPLLQGSYAVYWKEKNNRYRTGKLCHIYRPRIFDSRGEAVWGELDFDGDNLHISVPEDFLKKARYPVTVDPILGSTTRGAHWENYDEEPGTPFYYELEMPVYEYNVPQTIGLNMKAYMYVYDHGENEASGIPALYFEDPNQGYDMRRMTNIGSALSLELPGGETAGWRSVDFAMAENLAKGEIVWFGWYPQYFLFSYYDLHIVEVMDTSGETGPPDLFQLGSYSGERLLSQYFSYDPAPVNFTRAMGGTVDAGEMLGTLKGITRGLIEDADSEERMIRQVSWVRRFTPGLTVTTWLQGARKFFADLSGAAGYGDGLTATLMRIIRLFTRGGVWDYLGRLLTPGVDTKELYSPITTEWELTGRWSMKRVHVNQSRLVLKVRTGISLVEADRCEMRFVKPDGTTGSFEAVVGDVELGILTYKVKAGDLDMSGWWEFRAWVGFVGGDEALGRRVRVFVYG